ncbi:DUF6934 family protein [Mucilaginibacter sp.]|uniref:DUF6934 family protein n=1 Tax=Mucilaginibacter sp. TaxID=1882438 RepID=UPI0028435E8C|nr:hypothetical protein [Mucilaginibacter sp.]MDR3697741.1 hypothetical protein [Mucilaginibacter sp.]
MKLNRYELKSDEYLTTFDFLSEGPKGKIEKIIQFSIVNQDNVFNLAFGDKNAITGEIDDRIVTDNGDSEKVLATVVAAVYAFCDRFPEAWIYATGSTSASTRLYRMGINKYFDTAEADFEIFGQTQNEWERYQKGKDYQAFVIQRKNL